MEATVLVIMCLSPIYYGHGEGTHLAVNKVGEMKHAMDTAKTREYLDSLLWGKWRPEVGIAVLKYLKGGILSVWFISHAKYFCPFCMMSANKYYDLKL